MGPVHHNVVVGELLSHQGLLDVAKNARFAVEVTHALATVRALWWWWWRSVVIGRIVGLYTGVAFCAGGTDVIGEGGFAIP